MYQKNVLKWLVITNLVFFIFTQCSKDENTTITPPPPVTPVKIDKREKFVGTWYGTGTWTFQANGQNFTIPLNDTIQIQLSIVDTIKIVNVFKNRNDTYYVNNLSQLNQDDNTFILDIPINGTLINFTITEKNILGTLASNGNITYTSTTTLFPTKGGATLNGVINIVYIKK